MQRLVTDLQVETRICNSFFTLFTSLSVHQALGAGVALTPTLNTIDLFSIHPLFIEREASLRCSGRRHASTILSRNSDAQ